MSNVYAGYFIAGGAFYSWRLAAGLVATSLFIMAGMALNDVSDREIDTRERPDRPIPSGAVSAKAATRLSIFFMAAALLLIGWVNLPSIIPAGLLCYSIYVYNFITKGKRYGPLTIAGCRMLNLLLGLSLGLNGTSFFSMLNLNVFLTICSLGAFIILISFLASKEVEGNTRERVNIFFAGLLVWLLFWILFLLASDTGFQKWIGLTLVAAFVLFLGTRFLSLLKLPDAKSTGSCVGGMLMLIPLVDVLGMLVNGVGWGLALAGLLFIPLGVMTGKYFYST
jgi:4-hydroxybenzoate polyprenyltransferase